MMKNSMCVTGPSRSNLLGFFLVGLAALLCAWLMTAPNAGAEDSAEQAEVVDVEQAGDALDSETGEQAEATEKKDPKASHCGCAESYSKGGCDSCNGLGDPEEKAAEAEAAGEPVPELETTGCGCKRRKAG